MIIDYPIAPISVTQLSDAAISCLSFQCMLESSVVAFLLRTSAVMAQRKSLNPSFVRRCRISLRETSLRAGRWDDDLETFAFVEYWPAQQESNL
jgi:hypothetical protein